MFKRYLVLVVATLFAVTAFAENSYQKEESATKGEISLPYFNMDSWITRTFKESGLIGGNTKTLYAIGPTKSIAGPVALNEPSTPWATSNVLAKVGVTKGSNTVFPEKRGSGLAARLETRLEEVVVLGMINLKVVATGSIYVGKTLEPVRDTKNPMSKLQQGIPFSKHIKALKFDYKTITGGKAVKGTGFGSPTKLNQVSHSEVMLLLQKRWEDKEGNLYAKRVGTAHVKFEKSTPDWINGYTLPVLYGDITTNPSYKSYMNLTSNMYGRNSKGENVPIKEVGWGAPSDSITHMTLRFSAGDGGAYIGAPGDMLWVDNVKLIE